jgi:hypothetical protein
MRQDLDSTSLAVESWLDGSPGNADPNAVLDRVIVQLNTTGQRPASMLAWYASGLKGGAPVALAAIAIGLAMFLGLEAATTPAAAEPTPSPEASSTDVGIPVGPLDSGTYAIDDVPAYAITIGPGWRASPADPDRSLGLVKLGVASIGVGGLTEIDLGAKQGLTDEEITCGVPVAPSISVPRPVVAATLENVELLLWRDAGAVRELRIDGRRALERVELGDLKGVCQSGPPFAPWDPMTPVGVVRTTTTFVEVDGALLFIQIDRWEDLAPIAQQELEEIIASIRFIPGSQLTPAAGRAGE